MRRPDGKKKGKERYVNILQECQGASRIAITGHVRPDGDCVGSCLALYQYLLKKMPQARVQVYLEKPAEIFAGIKGYDQIDTLCEDTDPYDVFFVLDSVPERMMEPAQKLYAQARKTVNIDHHISNSGAGDVSYVVPGASSTAELIYELIDKEALDTDLATAIYIGIIHDTGVFQYSNTSPRTMEIGAHLIRFGFDFPKLIQETFYQKTYLQSHVLGRVLLESIRFMDGSCIVSGLDRKTMDFYGVEPKDLDGIVNHLRNIKGIHCAIFMYQTGVLEYKVSLRSDELVDVSEVASFFGGGGHVRAAGCTMKGTFHDCVNNLSLHIEKQLEAHKD
ncbi:MAG: bifunctional oligoribonuclease/PAP phosphatase NrnA [Lachnospiraceae bacterium]|nr:bifunctional oligoribonuclease/PAP phosphatase NrnA [Lachnospiraceae bacterium]